MRWWSTLALVLLLAGCFGGTDKEETPDGPAPGPQFDLLDPRLPHLPDGTVDVAGMGTPDAPGFPVFGPPAQMNQQSGAARETSLAVGPAGSGLRLACDPSGVPNIQGGQSYFYLSADNGTTWSDLQVEGDQTDPRQYAFEGGDCDVAVGPSGELWTADTWLGSLSVGRSRDGGASWVGTSLAGTAPGVDRPWLVTDGAGVLHLTYQDVQALMPSAIWYTRLATNQEGALAFTPAVPVADASPDGAFTWTGNLVVSDDAQSLWSVYTRRTQPTLLTGLEDGGPETVWVARSTDGGLTFTSIRVSDRPAPASFLYASIAQDAGGILHVVFAQSTGSAHPVFHSYSTDQGSTWSEPAIVLDNVYATSPWVAGGQAGQAILQWHGSPDPTANPDDNETAWYTYWATVHGAAEGNATYRAGTSTAEPLFVGAQGENPEFNMVRTDSLGLAHLGTSARVYDKGTDSAPWQAFYQAQVAGPAI